MKKFELAQYSGLVRKSDLSRDMTMRNASAHRRLEGELKHLDLQLHQSLVTMQADIVDLKLSQPSGARGVRGKLPVPQQAMKKPLARTGSGPPRTTCNNTNHQKQGNKQLPTINVQSDTYDSPILPQISKNQSNGSMVNRRKEDHSRARSFLTLKGSSNVRPASAEPHPRGLTCRSPSNKDNLGASLSVSTNLYRPHSTPDLSSFNCSGRMTPKGHRRLPPLERKGDQKPSSSDCSSAELSNRVKDFVKRPNTSSGERQTAPTNGSKSDTASDQTTVLDTGGKGEETTPVKEKKRIKENRSPEREEVDMAKEEKDKLFSLSEDDLFFNSNLLKAHTDAPLSTSLPDLARLGFMDYNEVIDRRLRDLQEWQHNPPTEEEMKKVKYLRLKNESQTPHVLSVFDKDQ